MELDGNQKGTREHRYRFNDEFKEIFQRFSFLVFWRDENFKFHRRKFNVSENDKRLNLKRSRESFLSSLETWTRYGAKRSTMNTRKKRFSLYSLLTEFHCFFIKNHIMAAKIPRYILLEQKSVLKHVVLFMLWRSMWKIGCLLMFNSLRFIKFASFPRSKTWENIFSSNFSHAFYVLS